MSDGLRIVVTPRQGCDVRFFEWLRSADGGNCMLAGDMGDGRYCAVKPLLFHWTLIIGVIGDREGFEDRYCYSNEGLGYAALLEWSQRGYQGEPHWWHRHPKTGRRRIDGSPEFEFIAP